MSHPLRRARTRRIAANARIPIIVASAWAALVTGACEEDGPPASPPTSDAATEAEALDAARSDAPFADAAPDAGATDGGADAPDQPDADPCAPPSADNLLVNPGFDTDVTSWDPFFPSIAAEHVAEDALGCATSGSIGVLNTDDAGVNSGMGQCVTVTEGVVYGLGAHVNIPVVAGAQYVAVQVNWYEDPGCNGPASAPATVVNADMSMAKRNQWQAVSAEVTAPPGARSALVFLQIIQGPGAGFRPLFDRVYLSRSPSTF